MPFLQVEECAAGLHPRLCGGDWAAPLRDQEAGGEGRHQWRRHESQRYRYHLGSVADPECLSRVPEQNFSIPDPIFFHPGSASKNLSILTHKNGGLSTQKYDPGCPSRIRILFFYLSRIPDPRVKKAPDPGSGSATLHFWHCYGSGSALIMKQNNEIAKILLKWWSVENLSFLALCWRLPSSKKKSNSLTQFYHF